MKIVFGANNVIINASQTPEAHFHPDYAVRFIDPPGSPPEDLGVGWRLVEGDWIAPPESEAAPAVPVALTKLAFTRLVREFGGLASIAAAKDEPALADFWIVFDLAAIVERDDPDTIAGLNAMEALDHLPMGAAAVLAAWPVA